MQEFLQSMISGIIYMLSNAVLDYFSDSLMVAADLAFDAEGIITGAVGSLNKTLLVIYGFGIGFLTIKFIKKGLDTYVLRIDGDPDADPLILLTNFFKAMIISICFGIMYTYFISIVRAFLSALLSSISISYSDIDMFTYLYTQISTAVTPDLAASITVVSGLLPLILILVYLILYTVLMVMFLVKGIQLTILRYGIVLATVGLLDSDQGSYKPYLKKFVQIALTIVVQIFLFQISIPLMVTGHPIYGVSMLITAMTAPKFLNEFIMVSNGSPTQLLYSANLISGMFRRGA